MYFLNDSIKLIFVIKIWFSKCGEVNLLGY